jgi:hypothetical protein
MSASSPDGNRQGKKYMLYNFLSNSEKIVDFCGNRWINILLINTLC